MVILHPSTFPEQLAEDMTISWSNQGDLVFDPLCGVATTLKVAKMNNRNYLGVEINEEYCRIARKRMEMVLKTREVE
jgi:site-specific DNA-methyltransferase (adenine-specific)